MRATIRNRPQPRSCHTLAYSSSKSLGLHSSILVLLHRLRLSQSGLPEDSKASDHLHKAACLPLQFLHIVDGRLRRTDRFELTDPIVHPGELVSLLVGDALPQLLEAGAFLVVWRKREKAVSLVAAGSKWELFLNGSDHFGIQSFDQQLVICHKAPTFDLTLLVEVLERNAQVLEFLERTAGRRQFVARLSADLDHELGELRIVLDVRF